MTTISNVYAAMQDELAAIEARLDELGAYRHRLLGRMDVFSEMIDAGRHAERWITKEQGDEDATPQPAADSHAGLQAVSVPGLPTGLPAAGEAVQGDPTHTTSIGGLSALPDDDHPSGAGGQVADAGAGYPA